MLLYIINFLAKYGRNIPFVVISIFKRFSTQYSNILSIIVSFLGNKGSPPKSPSETSRCGLCFIKSDIKIRN